MKISKAQKELIGGAIQLDQPLVLSRSSTEADEHHIYSLSGSFNYAVLDLQGQSNELELMKEYEKLGVNREKASWILHPTNKQANLIYREDQKEFIYLNIPSGASYLESGSYKNSSLFEIWLLVCQMLTAVKQRNSMHLKHLRFTLKDFQTFNKLFTVLNTMNNLSLLKEDITAEEEAESILTMLTHFLEDTFRDLEKEDKKVESINNSNELSYEDSETAIEIDQKLILLESLSKLEVKTVDDIIDIFDKNMRGFFVQAMGCDWIKVSETIGVFIQQQVEHLRTLQEQFENDEQSHNGYQLDCDVLKGIYSLIDDKIISTTVLNIFGEESIGKSLSQLDLLRNKECEGELETWSWLKTNFRKEVSQGELVEDFYDYKYSGEIKDNSFKLKDDSFENISDMNDDFDEFKVNEPEEFRFSEAEIHSKDNQDVSDEENLSENFKTKMIEEYPSSEIIEITVENSSSFSSDSFSEELIQESERDGAGNGLKIPSSLNNQDIFKIMK